MASSSRESSKRSWSTAFDGGQPSQDASLIPVTLCLPQHRRPRGTRSLRIPAVKTVVVLGNGRKLASRQQAHGSRRSQDASTARPSRSPTHGAESLPPQNDTSAQDSTTFPTTYSSDPSQEGQEGPAAGGDQMTETQTRNLNQYKAWTKRVLPELLPLYMRQRRALSSPEVPANANLQAMEPTCTCGEASRHLTVTCVYFDGLKVIEIHVCKCRAAPLQLLERGLFACAPCAPSVAVSTRLLQLCRETFVRVSPNVTGWSEAVEALLSQRGIRLDAKDGMRKRFGRALQWFGALHNLSLRRIESSIDAGRAAVLTSSLPPSNTITIDRDAVAEEQEHAATADAEMTPLADTAPPPQTASPPGVATALPETSYTTPTSTRASAYLWHRCPACFSREFGQGDQPQGEPHVIVCIDANFTQKRCRQPGNGLKDPPLRHPESVFISDNIVQDMAARVERQKPTPHTDSQAHTSHGPDRVNDEDDKMEDGMRIPKSVLDTCNRSFIAADERRTKASTQMFADTGLMALLCRHDRVLWLANMTSAGEKQYYALALVEQLFKQLPSCASVGLLYDIACQLHRSCLKFGFLSEYLDRLMFALAVFHAYGHHWACQVIYHPRKCRGFGWSDGEGCERFWSSIKGLIAPLRVSGFHRRILLLDEQVQYQSQQSLQLLGEWLEGHWKACQKNKLEALVALHACAVDYDVLRAEWAAQVQAQTKPSPKRTRNAAKAAIQVIHSLEASTTAYEDEIEDLEQQLSVLDDNASTEAISRITFNLEANRAKLKKVALSIKVKTAALGVEGHTALRKLRSSKFLQYRLSALAHKCLLRDKVRARKYEKERLERAYRNVMNERSELSLSKHTEEAIKRRDPGIVALANKYNKDCKNIIELIAKNKAPPGAVAPCLIDPKNLFKLDVDDDIWQDVGLDDGAEVRENEDGSLETVVPRWLGDANVRAGINALLKLDRCKEEERRLERELRTLWEWGCVEWQAIEVAKAWAENNVDTIYLLDQAKTGIEDLLRRWRLDAPTIIAARPPPPFSPTELQLAATKIVQSVAPLHGMDQDVLGAEEMYEIPDDLDDDNVDGDEDPAENISYNEEAALAEEVENNRLLDTYRDEVFYDEV